ncbi:hypothetical protein ACFPK9_07445 [Rubritalea spongiae]|uniref:PEP-CTERM sorting domain-containing protein n=1 Tax=Rubritalea spongiae TaxID=430797 RepID=A0ABW5DZE6_9BACT
MRHFAALITTAFLSSQLTSLADIRVGETIGIDFDNAGNGKGIAPPGKSRFNHFTEGKGIKNGETLTYTKPLRTTKGRPLNGVSFSFTNNTGQSTNRIKDQEGQPGPGLLSAPSISGDRILSNDTLEMPINKDGHFVLTFSGLDDTLSYTLTGGYQGSRPNFDAIWSADGQSFESLLQAGYGTLTGLRTDGRGTLKIIVQKRTKHVILAGLTLTATIAPYSSDKHAALINLGSTTLLLNHTK